MPATPGLAECVRGAAGPGRGLVPVRAQQRLGSPGTQVCAGDDGAGNDVADPHGMGDRAGLLAVGPAKAVARRAGYHRAPADFGAVGALVRIATCISGRVEVMVNCAPLFGYGTAGGMWSYQGEGYDAMTVAPAEGDVRLELAGSVRLGVLGARCYGRTTRTQGQSAFMVLSWGDAKVPANQEEAFSALNTTVDFWRDWLSTAKIPDHPWKPYLDRSALTLKAPATPHRRHHGRGDDLAAGTPGGRATGTTGSPGSGARLQARSLYGGLARQRSRSGSSSGSRRLAERARRCGSCTASRGT